MEYIEEVDENNKITGRVLPKEQFHHEGYFYREVIGFVINDKQEILIQKRASSKKDKPNMWEICYGHVSSGEKPDEAIVRELKEEIDLEISQEDLIPLGIEKTEEYNSSNHRYHNAFSYLYFVKTDKKIKDFKIQVEEVSDIQYISLEKLKEMLINHKNTLAFSNFEFILQTVNKIESILEGGFLWQSI